MRLKVQTIALTVEQKWRECNLTREAAVSRKEVIDELNRLGRNAFKDDTDYDNFFAFLDNLPPVTPKCKVGKWKRHIVDNGFNADWKCTECGYKVMTDFVHFNYCPNCGARMEE